MMSRWSAQEQRILIQQSCLTSYQHYSNFFTELLVATPEGAAVHNHVIQLALSMVASESTKIYTTISDGTVNLVDKFFEMQRSDAVRALDIYRRAGQQAERLSEFYEVCKSLDVGRGENFIKIEQPPTSFLQAMEEYVREAPRSSTFRKEEVKHVVNEKPTEVLQIEDKDVTDVKEERPPSPPPPEPVKEEKPLIEVPDLLSMDDPIPVASKIEEKNALALAIVPIDDYSTAAPAAKLDNGTTGWELALVTAPSSNETAVATTKLAGGLDKLTLDSLYDDAMRRTNQPSSYNPWEPNQMIQQPVHDPFYASNAMVAPHPVQMAAMAQQQQAFMFQQQQQAFMFQQQQQQQMMMGAQLQQPPTTNPFANPYTANPQGPPRPMQTYNPYTGYM